MKVDVSFDNVSETQGIYVLQPNIVNGKTFWFHNNGQFAIWYLPKGSSKRGTRWIIGYREQLGQAFGFITSPDDVAEPQEATTWEHFDGTVWKSNEAGDVLLTEKIRHQDSNQNLSPDLGTEMSKSKGNLTTSTLLHENKKKETDTETEKRISYDFRRFRDSSKKRNSFIYSK